MVYLFLTKCEILGRGEDSDVQHWVENQDTDLSVVGDEVQRSDGRPLQPQQGVDEVSQRRKQVTILTTFYGQLFHTKVICAYAQLFSI